MKLLSLLVYPLGAAIFLLIVGLVLVCWGRRRAGGVVLGAGVLVLWVFSMPVVGDGLLRSLEREWPDLHVEAVPQADAVLVLGGAFGSGNGEFVYPSAGGNVDRYWHAARIFHAGRAPRVILSGGRQPHLTGGLTEAEAGAMFLADMGVPDEVMILDSAALTTYENAVNVQAVVAEHGFRSLLVVTSASHMRRSMASLRRVDAELIPVATGFSTIENPPFNVRRYLPSVSGLSRSTRAVHELVGYWFYRVAGRA